MSLNENVVNTFGRIESRVRTFATHQLSVPRYMLNTDIPYPERVEVINARLCDEHYEMIDSDKSWRHWLNEREKFHEIGERIKALRQKALGHSE
jgi:hypothetical protein